MSKSNLPKLEDVARLAGVSTATVSRCLNQPNQVVEATRKRVQAAVDELGYMPNFSARALAAKRSNTIGAVIPTMENAIFARALQAFQEKLSEHKFDLLVASSTYRRDIEAKQIRSLVSRGAEGILLIGTERDQAVYDFLSERDIPFVIGWSFVEESQSMTPHHHVGFDNKAAMIEMVHMVLDMGHKNVAMLSGIALDNDRAQDRILGFKSTLIERGLSDDPPIIECKYDVEGAREAFAKLLEKYGQPTALICANDVLAVGAILEAQSRGINVPNDMSVTGFDDIEIAKIISPPLTTVHVPHRVMGRLAAQTLLGQIQDSKAPMDHQLKTNIVSRETLIKVNSI